MKEIRPDILDIALRINNIQLHEEILKEVCRVIHILQNKGKKATIKDVIKN